MGFYLSNKLVEKYINYRDSKNSCNKIIEEPAVWNIIGNVKGKNVLDVGCGSGEYSKILKEKGANVTAIDVNQICTNTAKSKGVKSVKCKIEKMKFKKKFDMVLCNLVIGYIKNLNRALKNINNSLKKKGVLILSDIHPFKSATIESNGKRVLTDYFSKKEYQTRIIFGGNEKIRLTRRTFEEIFGTLINNGFTVETIIEPKPIVKKTRENREIIKKYSKIPLIILIKAKKM